MKNKSVVLLPRVKRAVEEMGNNIKMARLRRKLSTQQAAERANITRMTLYRIEKGSSKVSLGAYAQVLFVLGLEQDLTKVASDDQLGRKLQDAQLTVKERAPKKEK